MTDQLAAFVVRILATEGTVVGAGFLVDERRVLACAHVVTRALGLASNAAEIPRDPIHLDFPLLAAKPLVAARVIHWQPAQPDGTGDVAGLELEGDLPAGIQPARLVQGEDFWEHPFRVFGFPAGLSDGVWATGVLQGRQASGWVQIEDVKTTGYRVQPGFSGAPVWDEELDGVAGMAVAAEARPEVKAAFILPVDVLVKAWPALNERTIPPCPYRGLFAFREQDAPFFFGRQAFADRLVEIVRRKPLVALIGPSGSGKSSVVFAGLLPRLRQESGWGIAAFRPGARPLYALAAALSPLLEPNLDETERLLAIRKLAEALEQAKLGLREVVDRILEKSTDVHRLLLVVDQFEELYTLCPDPESRRRFTDELLHMIHIEPDRGRQPVTALALTLRADFLGSALAHRPLADALQDANLILGAMTRHELRQAIEGPAQKQGLAFEAGLIERILDDVGDEPGNLPLLEFALTSLWKQQARSRLTHAAYEAIGRVQGALARYADGELDAQSPTEQARARRVFLQMVRPGEGVPDTRRLATRAELGEDGWRLAQRLADARLVVTDRDPAGHETAEIAHETLLQDWDRLRNWMTEDRSFRAWQERFRVGLAQWQASGQDEGALLRGAPLAQAEKWLAQRRDDLNLDEQHYIQASLALRQREGATRKRDRIFSDVVGGLSGGALGGLAGGIVGLILVVLKNGWGVNIAGLLVAQVLFGASFGVVVALGISLGKVLDDRGVLPIVGAMMAGVWMGMLMGVFYGGEMNVESQASLTLGAVLGAIYGGGLALCIAMGTRFKGGRRVLMRGLIGALLGGVVGATINSHIFSACVGFGVAVGVGSADDRFQVKPTQDVLRASLRGGEALSDKDRSA
jgi:hypothetical protein